MKVDKKDLKILSKLLDDCRQSDRQIGMKLGMSGGAVRSRINKMVKNGIIEKFSLRVEPAVFGYDTIYIVTSGQDVEEITTKLNLIGESFLVVPCIGGITVCSIIVKENIEQKLDLARNLMKDVRTLSIFHAKNISIESNITKTDLEIINVLLKNPLAQIDEIASTTDLSTKTIAREIEKLQNEKIIQFTVIYDPKKIDGHIPFALLISVESNLKTILKQFQKEFFEKFMQEPIISQNQIVLFMYDDDVFKLDETIQEIQKNEHVQSVDMFVPKSVMFPQKWIIDIIKESRKSSKLHIMHQVGIKN